MSNKVVAIDSNEGGPGGIHYNIVDVFTTSFVYKINDDTPFYKRTMIIITDGNGESFYVRRDDFIPLSESRRFKLSRILTKSL